MGDIEVSCERSAALIANGAAVIDVREPGEFAAGALEDSLLIPVGEIDRVATVVNDRRRPVVVYCETGVRSAQAVDAMQQLGYAQAVSMRGGFAEWRRQGRAWSAKSGLTDDQAERYRRHLTLPEVGPDGQATLLRSRVLLVGAGGLGSPVAMYLAAAGVGTIGIADNDVVELSNLQRQIIHGRHRIGTRKTHSAHRTIADLNDDVDVVTHDVEVTATNAADIIADYDVVVDGSDNFPTRYALDDASRKLGIPVVHGSIFRFEGVVSVFDPRRGPTYRDLVPEAPPPGVAPSCAMAGVFGVLPGIVGSIQAIETIKLLLDIGEPLIGKVLTIDTLAMTFDVFALPPRST